MRQLPKELSRPPIPKYRIKCAICGDEISFPYARYGTPDRDDWVCQRVCDIAYTKALEKANEPQ